MCKRNRYEKKICSSSLKESKLSKEIDNIVKDTILDSGLSLKPGYEEVLDEMSYDISIGRLQTRTSRIAGDLKMLELFNQVSVEFQLEILLATNEFRRFVRRYIKTLEVVKILLEQSFWEGCDIENITVKVYLKASGFCNIADVLYRIPQVFMYIPGSEEIFVFLDLEEQIGIILCKEEFNKYKARFTKK